MPSDTRIQTRSELEDRVEALETRNSELLLEVMDLAEQLESHLKTCAGATPAQLDEVTDIADRLMATQWR